MKNAPRTKVAGVGTAVGAVFCGILSWAGCQPGSLPCDKAEWKDICASSDAGPSGSSGGSTGSGGSGGSTPSGSGGSSGTPDAAAPAGDIAAKTLSNCSAYKTVGDMDTFFSMRCGSSACHTTKYIFGDYATAKVYERVVMQDSLSCQGWKIADKADPTKGAMWAKIQDNPECLGKPTSKMPAPMGATPAMALTADEKKCIENYLSVLAGK